MTTCAQTQDHGRTEFLVDRLLAIVCPGAVEEDRRTLARLIHQSRASARAGDMDGALATLASADLAKAPRDLARWAYTEWLDLARRRFPSESLVVYSPGTGRAAILECGPDADTATVVAVLGLGWQPGKVLSRRCLRGVKLLHAAGESGGAPCRAS